MTKTTLIRLARSAADRLRRTTTPAGLARSAGDQLRTTNHVIPDAILSGGVVSRSTLANSARSAADRQQTVAGENSVARIIYGFDRVGAQISVVMVARDGGVNYMYILAVWAYGECHAIDGVSLWDEALPAGTFVEHHLGLASQTRSDYMHEAALYQSPYREYLDTLNNWCYSVFKIPESAANGFPTAAARIRGRKVALTQGGTPTYTDCPAYFVADFIENTTYCMGMAVDWTSVAAVAAKCNEMIGTPAEKRRTAGLSLSTVQDSVSWLKTLCAYAGCTLHQEANTYVLIPSATAASEFTFDKTNIIEESLRLIKSGSRTTPTIMRVSFTNTTGTPWRDDIATVPLVDELPAGVPRRESQVAMPGVQRYSQAYREAVERLNLLTLSDLGVELETFDAALSLQFGRVFTVTHPIGLAAKLFRCTGIIDLGQGRYRVTGAEYDPAAYSDVVVTDPTYDDTILPLPAAPPTVAGVRVAEEVYQSDTGLWASRLRIAWDGPDKPFPFVQSYKVDIRATLLLTHALVKTTNALAASALVAGTDLEYVTKSLAENTQYDIAVSIVSTTGAVGPAGVVSIVPVGKSALPKDFASLSGSEIGGEVRLAWSDTAYDSGPIDLDWSATELRYGAVGGTWATATLLDRIAAPALRHSTKEVPAGEWKFWARPLDSVRNTKNPNGQYSDGSHQASCIFTVTIDTAAFVAADHTYTTATLSNMSQYFDPLTNLPFWVTNLGDTWNSLFASAMSTYTNALYTYHTSGTSGLVTERHDFASSFTGDWVAALAYVNVSGTAVAKVELNSAGPEATKTITGATNANPISITSTAHGYPGGDEVEIAGVGGNTNANGLRKVVFVDADHYTLTDLLGINVAGNGTYTSGGTSARWIWSSFSVAVTKTTARWGRLKIYTDATDTVKITGLGTLKCNVISRKESGFVTTAASGPTIVYLANKYNKVKSVTVTPTGSTSRSGSPDQIEVSAARGLGVYYTVRFNGTSDYIDINDSASLQIAQPLTVEAWVNLTSNAASQTMVRKDTETGTRYLWSLQIVGSSGLVRAAYYNGTTFRADSLSPIALGRWVHVAMIISGTALYLLVDGVRQNSATISGTQNPPTGRMSIGCSPPFVGGGTRAEYFGGVIDDVRVWNVARADADIIANKDIELTGSETGLKGYWKLNSTSGTTATDSTANANTGTLSGGKWRPYDGFDAYAFTTSTGEQVPADCFWEFEGV